MDNTNAATTTIPETMKTGHHHEICEMRMARGLKAFCDPTLVTVTRPEEGFSTYTAAAEHARINGGRVRRIGNFYNGGPRRFIVA